MRFSIMLRESNGRYRKAVIQELLMSVDIDMMRILDNIYDRITKSELSEQLYRAFTDIIKTVTLKVPAKLSPEPGQLRRDIVVKNQAVVRRKVENIIEDRLEDMAGIDDDQLDEVVDDASRAVMMAAELFAKSGEKYPDFDKFLQSVSYHINNAFRIISDDMDLSSIPEDLEADRKTKREMMNFLSKLEGVLRVYWEGGDEDDDTGEEDYFEDNVEPILEKGKQIYLNAVRKGGLKPNTPYTAQSPEPTNYDFYRYMLFMINYSEEGDFLDSKAYIDSLLKYENKYALQESNKMKNKFKLILKESQDEYRLATPLEMLKSFDIDLMRILDNTYEKVEKSEATELLYRAFVDMFNTVTMRLPTKPSTSPGIVRDFIYDKNLSSLVVQVQGIIEKYFGDLSGLDNIIDNAAAALSMVGELFARTGEIMPIEQDQLQISYYISEAFKEVSDRVDLSYDPEELNMHEGIESGLLADLTILEFRLKKYWEGDDEDDDTDEGEYFADYIEPVIKRSEKTYERAMRRGNWRANSPYAVMSQSPKNHDVYRYLLYLIKHSENEDDFQYSKKYINDLLKYKKKQKLREGSVKPKFKLLVNCKSKLSEKTDKDKMKCNKPRYIKKGEPGYGKKQKVVKACKDGKEKIVRFGDAKMKNKSNNPKNRKNFRSRHSCSDKKDKFTAGYWSCKDW